jgi:hypothetical protein
MKGSTSAPTTSGQSTVPSDQIDESEFLAGRKGAGNTGGENPAQHFRIHDGYVAEIAKIMESGKFPQYDTRSDLYVHAIVRHIDWLNSIDDIPGSILAEIHQINEIAKEEVRKLKFSRSIEAISAVIGDVIAMPNGRIEAARMLTVMAGHISRMRQGFWRAHYESLFFELFGPYILEAAAKEGVEAIAPTASGRGMMFTFGEVPEIADMDLDAPMMYLPPLAEPPEEEMVH